MAVPVLFPDGTRRQVIAELRADYHAPVGNTTERFVPGRFVQCPINADPLWKYIWRNGRWIACPRYGSPVAPSSGDLAPWWTGIASMTDDAPPPTRTVISGHFRAA